ncbi:MAG: aspartate-semialdehyde dehydrogenase [Holosporaceae bacterium]|jgi:aspartate-semialdehyde dehydrogenase|nr:aspartate-semialdehyde dehydrogenase [Holosporaceae bacterium]
MITERKYNLALVGATGNVGMKVLQILEERNFPVNSMTAIASERSRGKLLSFGNENISVQMLKEVDFSSIDLAIFCAGSGVSRQYAEFVAEAGCVVLDKTSYFRTNPRAPLVIPEVNGDVLRNGSPLGIISTPNCVATPLAMTLKALSGLSSIKRAVVSTYQSVSGAGRRAVDELYSQSKSFVSVGTAKNDVFPKQIAFNVLPLVGELYSSGVSDEEDKIAGEIRKILMLDLKVAVTCVRVPVFIGHAMSVYCEFSTPFEEKDVRKAFENFDGILLIDRRDEGGVFATPLDIQGEDAVYVSRIRTDPSAKNGLLYWVVTDNLRKGAALNSVQIAEYMISLDPTLNTFKKRKKSIGVS